jgi:hypothetical protein
MSIWYINRLKTMSFAEILYRIRQSWQKQYELVTYKHRLPSSEFLGCSQSIIDTSLKTDIPYDNIVNIFGKHFDYGVNDIDWHRDIFTGEKFPVIFSKNINIRINPRTSAKNVWEINRLQFLVKICLNYKDTGKEEYLAQFMKILSSWIDENPYLQGINWYSNIEVNIRLINWFLCWQILKADDLIAGNRQFKDFVQSKWIPAIFCHCYYSYHNPSKYSSANNHLISEYAGLFIASSFWKFRESEKWMNYAGKGLEKEIILQHSSGINREEAAEYIQFITDFFLLSFIVGEKTGRPFPGQYKQQLFKIFCYIRDILDCNGNFPKYGDEDDGKCFIFDFSEEFNNFKSLLTSGAILFNDRGLKAKSNGFDAKNHFLFGDKGKKIFDSLPDIASDETSRFYSEEGHFIFRKRENDREIYMHFDAASLGFLSIAAHGHADALSFILNIDGHPVFIDSGTYTYHTEKEWRNYFIGTLAHNTIRINHKDQAVNGGPTLWISHYKTTIIDQESGGDSDHVKATHDGYENEGASHIREITLNRLTNEFLITDTIVVMKDRIVEIEIPFHIHPDIEIAGNGNDFTLSRKNRVKIAEFFVDEKLEPTIIRGQMNPQILGWYSGSFTKKEATNVIYCKTQIYCTTTYKFLIKII